MPSFTRLYYHIVFATKGCARWLPAEHRRELFAYIHGIVCNHDGTTLRINGADDHLHLFVALHPATSVAEFVKLVKRASNRWMRESGKFPAFESWQEGYAAFSIGLEERDALIEYIRNHEEQHRHVGYLEELRGLVLAAGLEWDERNLP